MDSAVAVSASPALVVSKGHNTEEASELPLVVGGEGHRKIKGDVLLLKMTSRSALLLTE